MKIRYLILFWIVFFTLLVIFLQQNFVYHFPFIEQHQLFLWNWHYLWEVLAQPGGFALWIGEFIVQFFSKPYIGAITIALLMTISGVWTSLILKQIKPIGTNLGLSILVPILLLLPHLDFQYLLQGTIAYIIVLKGVYFYTLIKTPQRRLLIALCCLPILYWAVGAATLLFAITASMYELLKRTKYSYLSLILPVEVLLLGFGSLYFSIIGTFRFALLPYGYYDPTITPTISIYFAWIALPTTLFIAFYLQKLMKNRAGKINLIVQIIVVTISVWIVSKQMNNENYLFKELDHYARNEQWQKICDTFKREKLTNNLNRIYLNGALAQRGILADSLFHYNQTGVAGLIPMTNKLPAHMFAAFSDIYFTMGNIATAQQLAFEADVVANGHPRMLKRLVQTNLINGSYSVAQKYIKKLELTYAYKDWAKDHRRFLYNDKEVMNDPLLGNLRNCLPINHLVKIEGMNVDLSKIVTQNPKHKAAIHYLGSLYLLNRNLDDFQNLMNTTYGTEMLPELPQSFQEALIFISDDPAVCKRFNITDEMTQKFATYKNYIRANNANQKALPNLLNRSFGNTYWFYFMFKQN